MKLKSFHLMSIQLRESSVFTHWILKHKTDFFLNSDHMLMFLQQLIVTRAQEHQLLLLFFILTLCFSFTFRWSKWHFAKWTHSVMLTSDWSVTATLAMSYRVCLILHSCFFSLLLQHFFLCSVPCLYSYFKIKSSGSMCLYVNAAECTKWIFVLGLFEIDFSCE